jgi:hypothetical protein
MHMRMCNKVGFMGIKLDMSKVYDRVEWNFIEAIMRKMGFSDRWVNLILECARIVTYAILINGRPVGNIKPTRGIQQGDTLSPYLFILCAEGLSSLLAAAKRTGAITGVPTSTNGPKLNQLFFADDRLLFCKTNSLEWRRVIKILEKYEVALGQKINMEKKLPFFLVVTLVWGSDKKFHS